jgi:hypothetical protein
VKGRREREERGRGRGHAALLPSWRERRRCCREGERTLLKGQKREHQRNGELQGSVSSCSSCIFDLLVPHSPLHTSSATPGLCVRSREGIVRVQCPQGGEGEHGGVETRRKSSEKRLRRRVPRAARVWSFPRPAFHSVGRACRAVVLLGRLAPFRPADEMKKARLLWTDSPALRLCSARRRIPYDEFAP